MRARWDVGMLVGVTGLLGWAPILFAETATATIRATSEGSAVQGTATLTETAEGLHVSIQVTGVSPGQHAWHIHQFGSCPEAGNAAGGHYNPDGVMHGFLPNDGPTKAHPGDLGNLEVGPDGSGTATVILRGVTLSGGKYAVAGRAIIVHEKADDFGQPTGNAGGRVGCGPILLTK